MDARGELAQGLGGLASAAEAAARGTEAMSNVLRPLAGTRFTRARARVRLAFHKPFPNCCRRHNRRLT